GGTGGEGCGGRMGGGGGRGISGPRAGQWPGTTATVGVARRSSRSTTACAWTRRAWTAAASVMPRNSPMSAPAMKPFGLAERSTRPFGKSCSRLASTSSSSASMSSESVLALAPALSSASQAMPSSSRARIQLRQGEPARSRSASGPSSRLRGARTSQTLPIYDPLSFKQRRNREAAEDSVHPLPRLRGRDRKGACDKIEATCKKVMTLTPSPTLPRKRGGGQTQVPGRGEGRRGGFLFFKLSFRLRTPLHPHLPALPPPP